MSAITTWKQPQTETAAQLPPLILHPFAAADGPDRLLECSRASLALNGLTPAGDQSEEDLNRKVLDGRYCELKMLCYVGKDVARWIEQCLEFAHRNPGKFPEDVSECSFAALLTENPPQAVRDKLRSWGVMDYRAIFMRALGLNVLFSRPPERDGLGTEFLQEFYAYADRVFLLRQQRAPFTRLTASCCSFDLYASGEYSQMLERSWEE